nr:MAG TPA: hypothetical protein [Caudoviricetes sp.]
MNILFFKNHSQSHKLPSSQQEKAIATLRYRGL